jgi:drug/metabolite transporter (DMT)-like permease
MIASVSIARPSRLKIVAAFAAVYTIWGSTYLTIRLAIDSVPPFLMAGVRFMLAGAILYVFARHRRGVKPERLTWAHWRAAIIIGACLLLAGNGLVSWSELYVDTGLVALIVATVPLFMALFAPLFGGQWIRWISALGIAIGLTGVVLLLHPGGANAAHWQTFVVIGAPLLWAIGSLYARRAPAPREPATATAMEMLAGGVLLFIAGLFRGELGQLHLDRVTGSSLAAFIYLVLIGSIVGYSAYIWLLHNVSSTSASTYAFVNPVVAVGLGAIFLGEMITASVLLAAGLIVIAVVLILVGQVRSGPHVVAAVEPCEAPVSEVA